MVLGHRRHSAASSRASQDDGREVQTDDETVVDAEQGNVLMHIISQLRPGADLSRVTLPTFILEPRSMLERITNFMAHPELLLPIEKVDDPVQRFVAVTKFYLSGWHIKPPGVKKPLNPILGEIFTGWWDYPDGTKGYYIAEQTSHHPPKSSYFFMAPEHYIRVDGTLKPRSKFLGNSAASMMEGIAILRLLNRGERYFITQPNMYARGILFGKMKYELGDHAYIRCPESGLMADIEFKTKGYFGGTYNAIGGFISEIKTGKHLFELSGHWNAEMYIKDLITGKKDLLFDATHAKETPPFARPIEEQEERESQRLWRETNLAIKARDHVGATNHKTEIEERQRQEAAKRADEGIEWRPRFFRPVRGGPGGPEEGEEDLDWIIHAKIDGATPAEQVKQILNIAAILPGQKPERKFNIPARRESELSRHDSRPETSAHQFKTSDSVTTDENLVNFHGEPKHEPKPDDSRAVSKANPALTQDPPGFERPQLLKDITNHGQEQQKANTGGAAADLTELQDDLGNLQVASDGSKGLTSSTSDPKRGGLKRMDSETHEEDEFVDAES
ncbi:uncharacterized protein PV09_00081 [Verruconis gallopava]|uniref:Oxysterol-binding protein n=1 Tax=Verruconis gallopava TaxID=253628 RepID=A0A0D2ARK5_9PEZI|nr:uncharacterized protein PV09_00081 [Verruconis gallopava]KIW09145.1 hypothetical protein PV09_00081 [Verruconis gallopava]